MAYAIRHRTPLKSSPNEDVALVLDEQEQEELVSTLRQQTTKSHERFKWGGQAIILLSVVLHLVSLTDTDVPPTATIIPSTAPPIPFTLLFTWLHIFIHEYLLAKTLPLPPSIQAPIASGKFDVYCAIGAIIAPIICVLLQCGWANFVWWSSTALLMCLDALIRLWIRQDIEGLEELEKLKYDAQGA